ncbi:hypothetical protein [Prosthecobacter sp.]|uniref:hypothetical protein n=1 Tax=Prosthecobacter sp. TaxID=1965333 RepID=UPI003784008D
MPGKYLSRKSTPQTWRQGDVFIIATDELPKELKARPPVLAEGEVTGHAHRIKAGTRAQVLADASGGLFLDVEDAEATILHEEHGPVTVPRGQYLVRIQREYHPKEIRRVID